METSSFDDLRDCLPEVDGDKLEPSGIDGWEILSGPHPILQLPPEVLSEIFVQCLPMYSAAPAAARAPMLLTTICKDWREIALSTPHLWSTFILSVDLVKIKDGCSLIQLFETWLARGGTCPLTMVINGVSSGLRAEHSLPASFISALSRSSSRWHDVNLMLPLTDFYRLQANEGLPQLRRLSIKATANTAPLKESDTPLPPLTLFSNAPLLRDVSLEYGFTLSNIALPLHQLTYFDSRASTTTVAHYLQVFREAPSLMEIRLDVHKADRWSLSVPVQSNVKSLNLRSSLMRENNTLAVLECLTCPELETLVIHGFTPMLSQPLLRFLPRSSPPLRELFLDFPPHLDDGALPEIVPCLTAAPTLVRLEIRPIAGETAHDLFNRMCGPASLFLPRLQTLRVQVNIGRVPRMSWEYDSMTCMLVARWNRQAGADVDQLQVFAFSFTCGVGTTEADPFAQPDSATFEQLEMLAEQGMDIELVTDREVWDFWSGIQTLG